MNINLTGKIALVTGSNAGIGRAIALALASNGAKVGVNCLNNVTQGQEVVAEIQALGGKRYLYKQM